MNPHLGSPAGPASTLKVLSLVLSSAVVVIAGAVALSVPEPDGSPGLLTLACVALVVLGLLAAETVGLATAPYPVGASPETQVRANESVGRFRELVIRRFVMVEAPFILSIALTFVVEGEGAWPVLAAAVPTALGVLLVTWPGRRNVQRVAGRLERQGGRSYLPEALDLA